MVTNDETLIGYGSNFWIANLDMVKRLEKGLPLNMYDRETHSMLLLTKVILHYLSYEETVKLD